MRFTSLTLGIQIYADGLIFAKRRNVLALTKMAILATTLSICLESQSQTVGLDVFVPISKYMVKGDVECLSAWFDDYLEISISDKTNTSSKAQAKQILKSFFSSHTPQNFTITHAAEKANMKYVLGYLSAGGENYTVTIFVSSKGESYKIQQLKIERL